ncbi:MAG: flagellar brake protein [Clostridiaceae bacterium]|nr:flagellar brake protein [Clostridiaceae bacterium]
MKFDELVIGLKIELIEYSETSGMPSNTFISQYEGSEGRNILSVATPIFEGRLYPIRIGAKLSVLFLYKDSLNKFTAKVIDRGNKHNISVLKLQPLSDIEKIQRRGFFRFDCMLPVNYRVIGYMKGGASEEYTKSITADLSGGGLCIKLKEGIEKESLIECQLFLNQDARIQFTGRVVRLTKYEGKKGDYTHEIGVLFEQIDTKDREKIISFIFEQQRKLIKKG